MAAFAQFGSDLDAKTQAQLERGKRIVEVFKQPQYSPLPVEVQLVVLFAVQNGFMDAVAVDKIKDYQTKLQEYLQTRKQDLIALITKEQKLSDEVKAGIKSTLDEFGQSFQ